MADERVTFTSSFDPSGFQNGVRQVSRSLASLRGAARLAGSAITAPLTAPVRALGSLTSGVLNLRNAFIALAAVRVARVFTDFESGLTQVSTLVDTTVVDVRRLGRELRGVGLETGDSFDSLNKALFDTVSAGVDAGEAIGFLEVAAKLAAGGATTTADAVKGVVSIINAFGLEASQAEQVADSLFTAMQGGITTVSALSSNIGKVAPIARQAGLTFDEMNAAVSALTKSGLSTEESITALRSVLSALIKPTADSIKVARQLGIEWNTNALRARGLAGFIGQLADQTFTEAQASALAGGNVTAFTGVASLAADGARNLRDILASMGEAAGSTERAFQKVSGTTEFAFKTLRNSFLDLFIVVGDAAKPFLDDVIIGLRDGIQSLSDREPQIRGFFARIGTVTKEFGRGFGLVFSRGEVPELIEAGIKFLVGVIVDEIVILTPTVFKVAIAFGKALIAGIATGVAQLPGDILKKIPPVASPFFGGLISAIQFGVDEVTKDISEVLDLSDVLTNAFADITRDLGDAADELGSSVKKRFREAIQASDLSDEVKNVFLGAGEAAAQAGEDAEFTAFAERLGFSLEQIRSGFTTAVPPEYESAIRNATAATRDLGSAVLSAFGFAPIIGQTTKAFDDLGQSVGAFVGLGRGIQDFSDRIFSSLPALTGESAAAIQDLTDALSLLRVQGVERTVRELEIQFRNEVRAFEEALGDEEIAQAQLNEFRILKEEELQTRIAKVRAEAAAREAAAAKKRRDDEAKKIEDEARESERRRAAAAAAAQAQAQQGQQGSFQGLLLNNAGSASLPGEIAALQQEVGSAGFALGGALIDNFGLAIMEVGANGELQTSLASLEDLIDQGLVNLALNTFSNLNTFFTDSLSAVFTGEFDKIGEAFAAFGRKFLQDFAKFIADVLTQAIALQVFKSIFGGTGQLGASLGGALGGGFGFNRGGLVGGFARGGLVPGPRGPNRDTVLAGLTTGEYVIQRPSVRALGLDVLDALNDGLIPRSALEGLRRSATRASSRRGRTGYQSGGPVAGPGIGSGSVATLTADEQTLDRLLAGGGPALFRWLRANKDPVRGAIGSQIR